MQATHIAAAERHNPALEYSMVEGGSTYTETKEELIQAPVKNELNGWYTMEENTYYFENGVLQSGFQTIDGNTYYFNEEQTVEINNEIFNNTFKPLTGSSDHQTGWFADLDGIGYLDQFGSMVTGQQEIDGVKYSFNEDGRMVTSKQIDEYYYDANGQGRRVFNREDIAKAALAQLGVAQDCTMLVTNSLKAVGINFHGAPYKYASLGSFTDDPQPGDICLYQGHVAIYIGDGMAVHGGWNGGTTAIFTVECSAPFIGYIRVDIPEYIAE